ncbi:hypothetical protein [Micromonospora sp. DT47]|uniref:hypothetical protein n=1 Tax=Micromonospora sp. DT47 TaxID=3393431 RepID=UPI003CF00558
MPGAGETGTEARPAPARPAAAPGAAGETGTEARPAPARPAEADPAAPVPRGGGTAAEARPVGAAPCGPTEARPADAAPRASPVGRRYASSAPGPGPPFEPGTWPRPRGELGSPYEFIPHTLPVAVGRSGAATGLP